MTTRSKSPNPKIPSPVITAAEIGEYAYCAKAWQLKREGVEPDGTDLDEGTAYHRQHGAAIAQAAQYERAGRRIVALAVLFCLLFGLYFLLSGGGR